MWCGSDLGLERTSEERGKMLTGATKIGLGSGLRLGANGQGSSKVRASSVFRERRGVSLHELDTKAREHMGAKGWGPGAVGDFQ